MKFSKIILSVVMSLLLLALMAPVLANFADLSTPAAFGSLLVASIAINAIVGIVSYVLGKPILNKHALSAVAVELWVQYIIDTLFKDNSFITKSFDEGSYVLGGSVVHIPQAGTPPTIVKNRSSFPATAVRRSDGDITYPLDYFTSDPTLITKAETLEISYDKMGSVLGEHLQKMEESIADELIYNWLVGVTAANIIRTTGADSAANLGGGATGTRKIITPAEFRAARKRMNQLNVPKTERYAVLDSNMYDELMSDTTMLQRDYAGELDMKNGVVTRLFGFDIIERSSVALATNATTPVIKATDATGATTDNIVALFYQKNAVARAMGDVHFFENKNDALHYGDIYSAGVKMGGRKRRTNGEGVVAVIQAVGA